jgi:uncharacterized protein YfaS (alpha-2-macroglobulin family)
MNGRPLWLAALGLLCLSACDKPESSSQPVEKQKVEDVKTVSAATGTDSVLMKKNDIINKNTPKPVIDKKQLEQLASRYANRALSVVDASEITLDGASAISLTFSVPLDPEQNFADLVQITDEDKGVVDGAWELTANLMELRLRHVEPNRKLIITVTDNLEAITHQSLKKEEQFRITTRDLQPSVGFASKGSLLPATLSAGLPVVALNVDQVDVDFFRVKDDKVASFANRWGSNSSLNWNTRELMPMADLVYGTRFDLKTEKNTRQTILLPLDGVAALKKPGVYVAVMHQSGNYEYYLPATLFTRSDIGLSMHRYSSDLALFTQSLVDGKGLSGVSIQLLSEEGQQLQTVTTDADGYGRITWNNKGRLLLAQKDEQVSIIALNAPSLDLSEFKIDGDYEHAGKLFFFAPRDLYRPGETVPINALLRDQDGRRVKDQPIKAEIISADGESVQSFVWNGKDGLYQHEYIIGDNASTGWWHLKATLGSGEEKSYDFRVEDFLPERMALNIKPSTEPLTSRDTADFAIEGHYLYGSPAAGNTLNGNLIIQVARNAVESLPGYLFGNAEDKRFEQNITLSDSTLNEKGEGHVTYESQWSESRSPLNLVLLASLQESGGRPVTRRSVQAVWPAEKLPAVHPLFVKSAQIDDYGADKSDITLDADSIADFNIAMINPQGQKLESKDLVVRFIREREDYYWYYGDGSWDYSSNKKDIRMAEDHITTKAGEDTKVSFPVEWGGYRIEVEDPLTGAMTSVRFWAGYRWDEEGTQNGVVRPDQLKMTLDRKAYSSGDTARVRIESPSAGKGYLLVESLDGLLWKQPIELPENGQGEFTIPVDEKWQRHDLYVSALLIRPASQQEKNAKLPRRAVGLIHLPLQREDRKINLELQAPAKAQPNQALKLHLKASKTKGDLPEKLHVIVSAVDSGVLNITDYITPDPFNGFFGKRHYGVDQFDIYGQLIEGNSAPLASLRYGGDEDAAKGGKKPQTKVLIVAQQSSVINVDDEGNAEVSFNLPDFNGELRLMAQVWGDDEYGVAENKVTVAAPLIAELAMPRFLAGGDKASFALDLSNNSGQPQQLNVTYTASDKLRLTGDSSAKVSLKDGERKTLQIPVRARSGFGNGKLDMHIEGVKLGNMSAAFDKQWSVGVRPAYPAMSYRYNHILSKDQVWALPLEDAQKLDPESLTMHLSLSAKPMLDIATHIRELEAYPYGCLEQTTSGLYPSLYVTTAQLKQMGIATSDSDQTRRQKIEKGIERLLGMQLSNGGFSLWDNKGPEEYWLTVYVTDFLLRARDQGFAIPATALENAQQRLLRYLQDRNAVQPYYSSALNAERFSIQSYAGLVLAGQKQAPLGALRQLYQRRNDAISGLPLIQLAVALQKMGDQRRVDALLQQGLNYKYDRHGYYWYADYGTELRDRALILSLLLENQQLPEQQPDLQMQLSDLMQSQGYLSTQERNALFMAARHSMAQPEADWQASISQAQQSIAELSYKTQQTYNLNDESILKGLTVASTTENPLYLRADVTGYPQTKPKPVGNGIHITREIFDLQGKTPDLNQLKRGDLLVVHLSVWADQRVPDALVVDLLPAGLELENQNLENSNMALTELTQFKELLEKAQQTAIKHQEYRDDRYIAAIELDGYSRRDIVYIVRAVSPGRFHMPMPMVESMYQPAVNARGDSPEWVEVH